MVTVRIAPSPTGYLHVGNVRTALVNWLFTRQCGGRFLLRIDDTDAERSKPEYETAIEEDLQWLGLTWDAKVRQSERLARYRRAAEALKRAGRLYACYETPEELEVRRKMAIGRGLPPIYDRAALRLTEAQLQDCEAQGRRPHWRFRLADGEVGWHDLVRGAARFDAAHLSDPVLVREDGMPVYTLASVVDDGELGITHVIRGEDHVSNTAVQVQLYEALGFPVPEFAHLALLKTKEGELSKRLGGSDVRSLRAQGILPMAVNSLLARLGTSDPVEPVSDLRMLVERFDLDKFGRAPAHYDAQELEALNEKLLHRLPYTEARKYAPYMDEAFWLSIRGNLSSLQEIETWWRIVHGDMDAAFGDEDRRFLREACALLPPEPWDEHIYDAWIQAVKATTDRKGKELFLPVRRALTGMEHGPELKILLPLLGRDKTMRRLSDTQMPS